LVSYSDSNVELDKVLYRLKVSGIVFLVILVIGTFGYYKIGGESVTLFDGFYMTTITITTIGFTEIIELNNNIPGRIFTVVIAFLGIGTITYFLSNLAALFIEGDIKQTFTKKKMMKKIKSMQNHYLVCGTGRVGRNIINELLTNNHEFVAADINENKITELAGHYKDIPALVGDCTDDEFLVRCGVKKAKGIFVATDNDNSNLVICLTCAQLNPIAKIIAKSKDIKNVMKMSRVGASKVINPEYIGGIRMASEMINPTATDFFEELRKSGENLTLEEIKIADRFTGQKVTDINLKKFEHTLLIALKESHSWIYHPNEEHRLKKDTKLVLLTNPEDKKLLAHQISKS